jgi:hypothetical protein
MLYPIELALVPESYVFNATPFKNVVKLIGASLKIARETLSTVSPNKIFNVGK